ncbi:MAG: hypothetical protein ACTSPC_07120, partial [Candidatus Heimdallarchaeota archaeon]
CSLVCLPTIFIPYAGYGILPTLAIIGIICGAIGNRKDRHNNLARAGFIISVIDSVVGIILMFGLSFFLFYIWN